MSKAARIKSLKEILLKERNNRSDEGVEIIQNCLEELNQVDMTLQLLQETLIGRTVHEFRSHPVVGDQARALKKKWKFLLRQDIGVQCAGRAAQALTEFRKRVNELQRLGQKKPDMVAYKELRHKWTPPKNHGEILGVPIGLKLKGRGEAAILGIHTQILSGIDAVKDKACFAVCISGGYADDRDEAEDGTIQYTGSGGQKGKRQVEDQIENTDNASLILSVATQEPIRVLRGTKTKRGSPMYCYNGLYRCTDFDYQKSTDGPMVYVFTLVPIPGQSNPPSVRVVANRPDDSHRGARKRLLDKIERGASSAS